MNERAHILVVDDDREIRTLLADYLEKNGLRVSAARDGNEMQRILGRDARRPDRARRDAAGRRRAEAVPRAAREVAGADHHAHRARRDSSIASSGSSSAPTTTCRSRSIRASCSDAFRRSCVARRTHRAIRCRCRTCAAIASRAGGSTPLHVRSRTRTARPCRSPARSIGCSSVLLAHAGRVLSRVQLMELVRGRDHDPFDRTIDVRVSRLRQILRDDARAPRSSRPSTARAT